MPLFPISLFIKHMTPTTTQAPLCSFVHYVDTSVRESKYVCIINYQRIRGAYNNPKMCFTRWRKKLKQTMQEHPRTKRQRHTLCKLRERTSHNRGAINYWYVTQALRYAVFLSPKRAKVVGSPQSPATYPSGLLCRDCVTYH